MTNRVLMLVHDITLREGATVMNSLVYFFSQHIPNPQHYNAYVPQDTYALIVILLP